MRSVHMFAVAWVVTVARPPAGSPARMWWSAATEHVKRRPDSSSVPTATFARRSFLVLALTSVSLGLVGCSERKARQGSALAFLDDGPTPGAPLWAGDPGAYVIGVPDGTAVPREAVVSAGGALIVLHPACPNDQRRVGWCPSISRFVCPQCSSVFDATGSVEEGPAPRGLSRYRASETPSGELSVDSARRTTGDRRSQDAAPTATRDPACVTLRFPPEPALSE